MKTKCKCPFLQWIAERNPRHQLAACLVVTLGLLTASPAGTQAAGLGVHWVGAGSAVTDPGGAFGVPQANWQNVNGANGTATFSPASGGALTVTWSTGGGVWQSGTTFPGYSVGENQVFSGCLFAQQNDPGCLGQISVTISGLDTVAAGAYTLQLMAAIDSSAASYTFQPATVTDSTFNAYTLNFNVPVTVGANNLSIASVTTNLTVSGDTLALTICNDTFPGTPRAELSGLVILYAPAPAPVITTQPLSQTVASGGTATFTVLATGSPAPLTYQWQLNDADIFGATGTSYQVTGATDASVGNYRVKVTDGAGRFSFSAQAALIVRPASPVVIYDASTASTFAGPSSYGPGVGNFFNVVPGTSLSVTRLGFHSPDATIGGAVTVQLFDVTAGTVLATVTLGSGDLPTPVGAIPLYLFLKAPTNSLILGPGSYAVVQYGGVYANAPAGATVSTCGGAVQDVISRWGDGPGGPGHLPTHNDGNYHYAGPTLEVSVSGAPVISGQPQGGAFVPGSTVTLNVAAGGSLPLAYQWKKNGGNISGATSSILTLPSVALSDSGDYQVVVANSLGSTPSVIATVSVAVTPTLRIQMNPGIVIEGTPGAHYRVEYSTAVAPTTWLLLEDIPSLPMSPWVIYDPTPTDSAGKRFYRAVLAP